MVSRELLAVTLRKSSANKQYVLTMSHWASWVKCCTARRITVCCASVMRNARVNPIMQIVSPFRQLCSRLTRSLPCLVGVAGVVVSFGVCAGGVFPAVSQPGSAASAGAHAESVGLERRTASDQRLSLKRTLVSGRPPSGSEERRHLSSDERRALLQDLRAVTRSLHDGGYSSPRSNN